MYEGVWQDIVCKRPGIGTGESVYNHLLHPRSHTGYASVERRCRPDGRLQPQEDQEGERNAQDMGRSRCAPTPQLSSSAGLLGFFQASLDTGQYGSDTVTALTPLCK